jgi:hypothetical protein
MSPTKAWVASNRPPRVSWTKRTAKKRERHGGSKNDSRLPQRQAPVPAKALPKGSSPARVHRLCQVSAPLAHLPVCSVLG